MTTPQPNLEVQLARIAERQEAAAKELVQIRQRLDLLEERFVTQHEFQPVRTLVYAFVGLILMAVAGALIALVVQVGMP